MKHEVKAEKQNEVVNEASELEVLDLDALQNVRGGTAQETLWGPASIDPEQRTVVVA